MADNYIRVRGAKAHNLKNVSVDIPKRRLSVFTGVSGSGKSSLVFGTIAAESRRLIDETYSTFVQGFMPNLPRPEVDVLEGLTTAIIVDQERMGANPRSTLGTVTDAHAMLRSLFSRIGEPSIGGPTAFSFNIPTTTVGGASVTESGKKNVIKQQVYADWENDLETSRIRVAHLMKTSFEGGDFMEGVLSFLQKRTAAFPPLGQGSKIWDCDEAWRVRLMARLPQAHQGVLAGSDVILGDPQTKVALYARTGALAVDMESHIAARFAAARGLPLAALRVVSDDARHILPPAALVAMKPDGGIALGRVLWSLAKNPLQLPALMRTGRNSSKAFKELLRCRGLLGRGLGGFLGGLDI